MIHANELRIGNWVEDNVEYVQVTNSFMSYLLSQAMTFRNIDEADFKSVNPIPLTPEILEKAGFEKCSCGGWKGNIHLNADMSYNKIRQIRHVHQLQNLYFALTGEELTINL